MPTSLDMPEIEVDIVQGYDPTGPFGAKGVGEPTAVPTAAAILNAIYDAVGVRITSLPATSEKVLAAIKAEARRRAQADPGLIVFLLAEGAGAPRSDRQRPADVRRRA